MEDFFIAPLVLIVGVGLHFVVIRRFEPAQTRLLNFSFVAHIGSGFAQILIYGFYYGSGDMTAYRDYGIPIAEALRYDFSGILPGTVALLFQQPGPPLPFEIMGVGSTGSMLITSAYLLFLLGNSYYAATLTIAVFAYLSKVMIYRALEPEFEPHQRRMLMIAICLIPTGVFWSAALLKEPIVMILMGPLFIGLRWVIRGRTILGVALVAVGALGMALFKAYVLLSFGAAAVVWLVWARVVRDRGSMAIKPFYLALALGLGMLTFTVAERYLLKRSQSGITQSMAAQRRVAGRVEGDSNFTLEGDVSSLELEDTSLLGEIALSPLALMTALYRPFIFEARKPMQVLNALETTWMLWATIQIFRKSRLTAVVAKVTASPALMFCLVFTVVLGLGTGLSTSNLGALSRYRAPMVPFYALLLLSLMPPRQLTAQERALYVVPSA